MASNDTDVGIGGGRGGGVLYEPQKTDYPNISQSGSDGESGRENGRLARGLNEVNEVNVPNRRQVVLL